MPSGESRLRQLRSGASTLAIAAVAAAFAVPAFAQDQAAGAADVSEVIVTGQRAALQSAQAIKRNSEQIVDSITATDIGALPDRSVTEALQRVPGITIGRTADGRDADRLSMEGSGVQIRGLSWVRGELNGRDTFSAKAGRVLSFEDVPPELMAGVDVYKNPSADIIEGGVGGTINLRTRMPFDAAGQVFSVSVDESYGDMRKKWSPSGSILYSNRWSTGIGEVGLLLDVADSKLYGRQDTISVDPYFVRTDLVPGRTVYVPGGFGYRRLDTDRVRRGYAAALQWRPNDQWEGSFQFLRSSASLGMAEHAIGLDPGSGNGPAAGFPGFTYDDTGHFLTGTLANTPGGTGLGTSVIDSRFNKRSSVTSDYSLHGAYNPNDRWAFSGDIQYVRAKSKAYDFTAFNSLGTDAAPATLDVTGDHPVITMNNNAAYLSSLSSYYLLAAMDYHNFNTAAEWAERLDGTYTFDDGSWLKRVRFGVRNTWREAVTRETNFHWDTVAPSWSAPSIDQISELKSSEELFTFDNYFRGDVDVPATFIQPTTALVKDYQAGSQLISQIAQKYGGGWRPFNDDYDAFTQGGANGGVNRQKEKTLAFYAVLNYGNDVSLWGEDREVDGNIGLRVVRTKATGAGLQIFQAGTSTALPAADLAFSNGARSAFIGGRDYWSVLPSFNFRLKITPDVFLRLAAAKSIVRPDFNQLQPSFNIAPTSGFLVGGACSTSIPAGEQANCVYQYTASSGNPDLKPTRSSQFDVSLEWYFAPTGSLTADVFYKDIHNFITNGVLPQDFTNNGVTRTVLVNSTYNAGHGTIKGFEVAYQQYYDFLPGVLKGLGAQANFTYIDSKGARNAAANPYDLTQVGNVSGAGSDLPLEGLSKTSYNIAALYDRGPISARIAYNWREKYLLTTTAANINIPAWNDDYGQLDASIFYTINDKVKVGVQGVNLANAETRILVSYPGVAAEGLTIHNWVQSDRRYSVVLRATF